MDIPQAEDAVVERGDGEDVVVDASLDEWQDILGTGSLMKKVITPGQGGETKPQVGNIVTINVSTIINGEQVERKEAYSFRLRENEVCPAWDMVVSVMRLSEKTQIKASSRFETRYTLKDTDVLEYEIELLQMEPSLDKTEMAIEELLNLSDQKRAFGVEWVKVQEWESALACFKRSLELLEEVTGREELKSNEKFQAKLSEFRQKCITNIAVVNTKNNLFEANFKLLTEAIVDFPLNAKIAYHLIKAQLALNLPESAEQILGTFDTTKSGAEDLETLRGDVMKMKQANAKKQKELFTRMASGFASSSAPPRSSSTKESIVEKKDEDDSLTSKETEETTPTTPPTTLPTTAATTQIRSNLSVGLLAIAVAVVIAAIWTSLNASNNN